MLPSQRLIAVLVVPMLLGLLGLLEPGFWDVMLGVDALILVLALADAWAARVPLVSVTREVPGVLSSGRPNPVRLSLSARAHPLHGHEEGGVMAKRKAAKRDRIDTNAGGTRFVRRRPDGTFKESDQLGPSMAADRRQQAKTRVKSGQGDRGDR